MHIPISEVKKLAYVWSAPYCADALPFRNAYFGEHSSPGTNLTTLHCYGNESQLIDCRHSNKTTCTASRVAGVRCQGKTVAGTFVLWCALAKTVHAPFSIVNDCLYLALFGQLAQVKE